MPFLLLMLLAAVALVITLIGYLLTSKNQVQTRNQGAMYQEGYSFNRAGRRVRVPIGASRFALYTEQSAWTWADVWQSLLVNRIFRWRPGEPAPWMGITLILVSLLLMGIILLRALLPNAALVGALAWPLAPANTSSPSSSLSNFISGGPYTASGALIRISQLDPAQYNSSQEFDTWAYSACSAASMTEVINAYGHHYRVTDILKVEAQIKEITPDLGLLEDIGIARTVTHFGFKTVWGHKLSLNDIIDIANHGKPVIVSFPPDRYAGGHLLVVTGGRGNYVYLADSSLYNRHSLTRAQFLTWWEGFSAIVTPN